MPNVGPSAQDLRMLAAVRLREAEALYSAGHYDGTVYLIGYVIECALKARVCRVLKLSRYPDDPQFFTHEFKRLRRLAGLEEMVSLQKGPLFTNWSLVTDNWRPDWRYKLGTTQAEALAKLDACRATPHGVLTWLSKRW